MHPIVTFMLSHVVEQQKKDSEREAQEKKVKELEDLRQKQEHEREQQVILQKSLGTTMIWKDDCQRVLFAFYPIALVLNLFT